LFKRMLCLCLAMALCLGCGVLAEEDTSSAYVLAGLDIYEGRDWQENDFFERMESMTGVKFTFRQYKTNDEWTKAKAAMEKGGDLPDVLFKANLSQAEQMDMLEKGVLIDLAPYLAEYAPNLWAILQQNPDYLAAITLPGGQIVALPHIQDVPTQNYLWINEEWLKTLKLQAPTNADELVKVLTAFRDQDPNRNGKQDEIPLSFLGPFDLKFLGHVFGLIANDYNVFEADGQVRFMPLEEDYRLFVTWLKDLYDAGLIDRDGFSKVDAMRQITDDKTDLTYGIVLTNSITNLVKVSSASQYNIMLPLEYNGVRSYRSLTDKVIRGAFAITSACEHPGELLGWVDTLYTEEGAILATIGMVNEDYVVDGDGTWRYLDSVQGNPYFVNFALIDGVPYYPGIQSGDFQQRISGLTAQQLAPLKKQVEVLPYLVRPFPVYSLTHAQEAEIAPLQNQIGYYVDIQLARWVLGEEEISDASFAAFEQHLMDLGLNEFMAFWQNVLDHN